MKPVSNIKINNKILIDYNYIHQYKQEYILENNELIILSNILTVMVQDKLNNNWYNVKKWKQYIFKEYKSRSSSMKGKNTGSKGRIPPNKGLTNEEFFGKEKALQISKKLSEIGFITQKNLSEESKINKSIKLSKSLSGKKKIRSSAGEKSYHEKRFRKPVHTKESKKKISDRLRQNYIDNPELKNKISHIGSSNGMFGRKHSKESIEKMSKGLKQNYKENKNNIQEQYKLNGALSQKSQNKKKSKPEVLVESWLLLNDFDIEYNYVFGFYAYDFWIKNTNILIEVQGDYWHANPIIYPNREVLNKQQKEKITRDIQKNTYATKRGFLIYYIWEYDIKNNDFSSLEEKIC